MFCYTHLKKTFEGQWPEYNWSKYSGAMERLIKVNRHKGGRVDIYFCSSVGSSAREAWVQILSEPEFFSVFFSAIGKIAANLRGSCLSLILHWKPQINIYFFLQIYSLNLRKEENLCFDSILFVNDSSVINKISLFDLIMRSQSGRGEVGMFVLSIHCTKKSPNWLFSPNNCLR